MWTKRWWLLYISHDTFLFYTEVEWGIKNSGNRNRHTDRCILKTGPSDLLYRTRSDSIMICPSNYIFYICTLDDILPIIQYKNIGTRSENNMYTDFNKHTNVVVYTRPFLTLYSCIYVLCCLKSCRWKTDGTSHWKAPTGYIKHYAATSHHTWKYSFFQQNEKAKLQYRTYY